MNRFLHNAKQSYARIYGFAGTTTIDGDEHGTLHAYVMSSQPGVPGTNLQYDVHTVPTLNSDLMSMEHWYANLNYDFHLVHDGFSGLELKDKDGSITHRIPVKRDPLERRWYLDIVIAHNADAAKAAGRHLQRFPPATKASLTMAEEQAVSNSNAQIWDQLNKHQSDTRAITTENTGEVSRSMTLPLGGVAVAVVLSGARGGPRGDRTRTRTCAGSVAVRLLPPLCSNQSYHVRE